jgi:phosphohistidine phosphatase
MKTLLVLRHAEAAGVRGSEKDHERQLTENGARDAARLGRRLALDDCVPDLALCSSAVRAVETLEILKQGGGFECALKVSRQLYESDAAGTLGLVRATDDRVARLLLVGHEPTFSRFVSALANEAGVSLAPGACACLDVYADRWMMVEFGMATLRSILSPGELGDG